MDRDIIDLEQYTNAVITVLDTDRYAGLGTLDLRKIPDWKKKFAPITSARKEFLVKLYYGNIFFFKNPSNKLKETALFSLRDRGAMEKTFYKRQKKLIEFYLKLDPTRTDKKLFKFFIYNIGSIEYLFKAKKYLSPTLIDVLFDRDNLDGYFELLHHFPDRIGLARDIIRKRIFTKNNKIRTTGNCCGFYLDDFVNSLNYSYSKRGTDEAFDNLLKIVSEDEFAEIITFILNKTPRKYIDSDIIFYMLKYKKSLCKKIFSEKDRITILNEFDKATFTEYYEFNDDDFLIYTEQNKTFPEEYIEHKFKDIKKLYKAVSNVTKYENKKYADSLTKILLYNNSELLKSSEDNEEKLLLLLKLQ